MNKCEDEVNALLGRRPSPPTPNRRPTPRPNRRVSMHLLGIKLCVFILLLELRLFCFIILLITEVRDKS